MSWSGREGYVGTSRSSKFRVCRLSLRWTVFGYINDKYVGDLVGGQKMESRALKRWVFAAAVASMLVGPCGLSAQEAATALSSTQQSAAKSALCSAIASKFPNPAAAGPSALSDPGVLSAAASSFAGTTSLPLPTATDIIKAYAMQHATDILGSCASANATGGVMPQMPNAGGLPSLPKMP